MTEKKLEAWLAAAPDDPEVLFTLGLMEKRQGHYSQAEIYYQKALQKDPKFAEAYSNLGNVNFSQGRIDLAIDLYQQAIAINPNKGAYYYNLYRAYTQEAFLSRKADQAFQKARELDPPLMASILTMDSLHMDRHVMDDILTGQRLWKRVITGFIGREGLLFYFFKSWFERIPSRTAFSIPILFIGLLIGISRVVRERKFLTRCPMCGSPTYRFYLGRSDDETICFNCYRLFIQKEKLHPQVADKKYLQLNQYQEENHFIFRFLSLFFVGSGYLWREDSFKGLVLLFVFFIFVLRFAYWDGVIPSSVVPSMMFPWSLIFWGGLFILFYFLSLRKVLRSKPRFNVGK